MRLKIAKESTLESFIEVASTHFFNQDTSEVYKHLGDYRSEDTSFILVYEQEEAIATVTIRWKAKYPPFAEQGIPLLQNIEVRHDSQGKGLGSKILEVIENHVRLFKPHLGICVGLFEAYGSAQKLYTKRGYIPDGKGICEGHRPLEAGETLILSHNHLLWLVKDLTQAQ